MARKKNYRRRNSFTIPLAVIAGVVGMPSLRNSVVAFAGGNISEGLNQLTGIVGVHNGVFAMHRLFDNIMPLIAGLLVHKFVGGRLGLNRALGAAGVPLIRI